MSDDDIENICKLWIAEVLEEDEEVRTEGLSDRDYRKWAETLAIVEDGERHAFARGNTELIEFEMEDFCMSHGFLINKSMPVYKRLAYAFLRANVEATRKQMARHKGEIVDTPKAQAVKGLGQLTLSQVLSRWQLEAKPKPKTIMEWELVISRFNALHGDLNVDQITKAQIVAYKDMRLLQGNAPATVTKQIEVAPGI